jgi:hypothetical protein
MSRVVRETARDVEARASTVLGTQITVEGELARSYCLR